jgi:iron complex outermembrane receptor protein
MGGRTIVARIKGAVSVMVAVSSVQFVAISTAQAETAGSDITTLETVVVTAEKRAIDVQSLPVAVDAVAGADLAQNGVASLTAIDKLVPAMVVERANAGLMVDIRGVEAVDSNPTSESPNSFYVDGAIIAHPTGYDGLLFDVDRIEVLKGPQGTLYGRNSNGGAVNLITRRPTNEFSAEASVETGSYSLINASGALNVPLADNVAVRMAFLTYSHTGYLKSGLDDANQSSVRIKLLWKPSERDSLLISGDLAKIGGKGSGSSNVTGFYAAPGFSGAAAFIPTDPRDDTFYNGPDATVYHYNSRNIGEMVQYDHDFDFATWTTEFAHRQFNSNPNTQFAPLPTWTSVPATFNSYSLESRLTSSGSEKFEWIVGAFAFKDHDTGTLNLFVTPNYSPTASPLLIIGNPSQDVSSWALFGQGTYTPTWNRRFHLTLGGRYSSDHKTADVFTSYPGFNYYQSGHFSDSWHAFTHKVTLGYDIRPRSMVYVTRSTGYEAGGFAYGTTPVFQPQFITDYEFGSKNRFFHDTLQVNVEGFYYKYRNFQQNVSPIVNGFPSPTVTNAGGATYKGVSLELQMAPTDSDTLKLNWAHYYARYGEFDTSVQYPGTPNLTGMRITNVPQYTGNFSYDHLWKMAGGGSVDAGAFVRFRGSQLMAQNFTNLPNVKALYINDPAWAMLDLSLKYLAPGAKWSLTGYVRNVTNGLHPVFERYNSSSGQITSNFYAPRTVGIIMTAKVN